MAVIIEDEIPIRDDTIRLMESIANTIRSIGHVTEKGAVPKYQRKERPKDLDFLDSLTAPQIDWFFERNGSLDHLPWKVLIKDICWNVENLISTREKIILSLKNLPSKVVNILHTDAGDWRFKLQLEIDNAYELLVAFTNRTEEELSNHFYFMKIGNLAAGGCGFDNMTNSRINELNEISINIKKLTKEFVTASNLMNDDEWDNQEDPNDERPVHKSEKVELFGPTGNPKIDGVPVAPLSISRYSAIEALVKASPTGLSKSQLEHDAKDCGDPVSTLRLLTNRISIWKEVVVFPGANGRGGYRIE